MTSGVPTRVVSASFALGAFAVALVSGLSVHNPPTRVLITALVAMVLCHAVATVVAMLAERTIDDSIRNYRNQNPVPDVYAINPAKDTPARSAGPAPTR